ncbi:2,3-bisphosphoglycerate-independent phosphoglycerate mutase [hydrothermal vent metagenome]|uniref:2,3-bisphosphoglycerate-independent phosphoglycerate mutase n=1 Tax=hydrothermal vent metagenome TaxID=652676 RepID=A0A3B0YTN4_9ZZZZ
MKKTRPVVLLILDGWGYSENPHGNAIIGAKTPNWDKLWSNHAHTFIACSGAEVGLPNDQMGNSEVGHLNLGAGRVVYQEYSRISKALEDGSFFKNDSLCQSIDQAVSQDKAVHILGLLSPGGVHSHEQQIHALVKLAADRGAKKLYVHAFLDGRDCAPKSATRSIERMEDVFEDLGEGQFASIIGRYYAMDRDHRWPRIQLAYDLITEGKSDYSALTAIDGLDAAYARGETDEFVQATRIRSSDAETIRINDGDTVIFANYRSDRARQITRAFIEENFEGFVRQTTPELASFVTLTEYNKAFKNTVAYPATSIRNGFGEYVAAKGLRQLRIAETEKYAHVTFFFNGGEEEECKGEDRILVPSPDVATYDLKPEMSAHEMTEKLCAAIANKTYDTIICNYANPDMVGHTGNYDATVKAIETIDQCLGEVLQSVTAVGGEMLITADHGNAEKLYADKNHSPHTAHTTNLVPLIYVGRSAELVARGTLADVAPTMLNLLGLEQPVEMSGRSLFKNPVK